MRVPYRPLPEKDGTIHLYPLVRVSVGRKGGQTTRHFEAIVDSGAADCIFHDAVATAIGIDLESGRKKQRTGISGPQDVWIHPVQLYVGTEIIDIDAAFARSLPVAGLLGRIGFFEHFKITFDPSSDPPGLELERVHKT